MDLRFKFDEFPYNPRFGPNATGLPLTFQRAAMALASGDGISGPANEEFEAGGSSIVGTQLMPPAPPNFQQSGQQTSNSNWGAQSKPLGPPNFQQSCQQTSNSNWGATSKMPAPPNFHQPSSSNWGNLLGTQSKPPFPPGFQQSGQQTSNSYWSTQSKPAAPPGFQQSGQNTINSNWDSQVPKFQMDRQKYMRSWGIQDVLKPAKEYLPHCQFCLSNGETRKFYLSHLLKNPQGQVTCPILRKYVCPRCGASGNFAHTLKYCPLSPTPLPKYKPIRLNANGRRVVSYN